MKKSLAYAALAAALCLPALANADTILYQDLFNSGGTTLNESTLDTALGLYGATANATWTASTTWKVNPTSGRAYVNTTGSSHYNAWLPFTPQAGYIYTLSADLCGEYYGSTGRYLAIGFAYGSSGIPSTSTIFCNAGTKALLAITSDGATKYKVGTAMKTSSSWTGSNITYALTNSNDGYYAAAKIVLDTTGTAWKATFSLDGQVYRTEEYASIPAITAVGMGCTPSTSYAMVKNFTLSATTIPEPGTLALLAAGFVGLLAYAWRKRN